MEKVLLATLVLLHECDGNFSWYYFEDSGIDMLRALEEGEGGSVAAKFEFTAYLKLAATKISNISIYGFIYVSSNIHGHFVAKYRI
jgi:hypothetical protein